jgi:hypothetical protein
MIGFGKIKRYNEFNGTAERLIWRLRHSGSTALKAPGETLCVLYPDKNRSKIKLVSVVNIFGI